MAWSEDSIHRWLSRRPKPRLLRGARGHDAAVLTDPRGREVCCVDQTIEGVHFDSDAAPSKVGFKAASRALSDLAATAAKPRALLLALSAPPECTDIWIRSAISAVARRAIQFGAELVAGDLASCPGPRSLSVTAIGVLPGTRRPPGRDRIRAGDILVSTGCFGGSRAGRHLRIEPRVEQGIWLHANGARAMMDVSDGLALDLWRMARASKVRIQLEEVPVHRDAVRTAKKDGRTPLWHALHDGEDHELLASVTPRVWGILSGTKRGRQLHYLGRARSGSGLELAPGLSSPKGGSWTPKDGGYLHGH